MLVGVNLITFNIRSLRSRVLVSQTACVRTTGKINHKINDSSINTPYNVELSSFYPTAFFSKYEGIYHTRLLRLLEVGVAATKYFYKYK